MFLHFCQQESHIHGQGKQLVTPADIIVTQLQGTGDVIFLRVFKDSTHRLGITCGGLTFHGRALTLIAHEEIKLQIRRKELLIIRMLTEIQIYHMPEMPAGKINNTAGLAALADSLHHKRLVRGIVQLRLEYIFYLTPIHYNTFSYRLSYSFSTFSYRLLVQGYTFSTKPPNVFL